MTKQQPKNQATLMKSQRVTLLVCGAIMAVFILFVAVVSNGSLSPFTFPHIIVLLASWYVWKAEKVSDTITRAVVFLSVVGAASAIFFTWGYRDLLNYL